MSAGGALVGGALAVAAADWVAVARGSRRAEYVLKPLALLLLLAAAVALRGGEPAARWWLTVAALALSLAGDVFLMLPRDRFLPGLGSFLLAHLAYVAAFNTTAPPARPMAAVTLALVLLGTLLYLLLLGGMRRSGRERYAVPVAVYSAAIVAMAASAFVTAARPEWPASRSALAMAGATLFLVSDGLIGWTRFVRGLRHGRLAIMVTYHLAQAMLVLALLA